VNATIETRTATAPALMLTGQKSIASFGTTVQVLGLKEIRHYAAS